MNNYRGARHWRKAAIAGLAAVIGFGFVPRATAQERREHWEGREGPGMEHREHWREGRFPAFPRRDFGPWRGGRWFHGNHRRRLGWWWVVGDAWYFYPAPIYPYPDPYIPPSVVAQAPPPSPTTPPQYWYYCQSARLYYPYVTSCPEGWMQVAPQ